MINLNYILVNTRYRVTTQTNEVFVGTIDEIGDKFDNAKSFDKMPAENQIDALKPFFNSLENYIKQNGYIFIEDYYPIWKENQ